jgi:DNA-directed RNA polymerase subunit M/transcription elongation factor TFIIS
VVLLWVMGLGACTTWCCCGYGPGGPHHVVLLWVSGLEARNPFWLGERRAVMPIELFCPGCGKPMRAADGDAGRKGQCPECGTKVQIPNQSIRSTPAKPPAKANSTSRSSPATPSSPASHSATPLPPLSKAYRPPQSDSASQHGNGPGAETSRAAENRIRLSCPRCAQRLQVPQSDAGKLGQCPRCGTQIPIPGSGSST